MAVPHPTPLATLAPEHDPRATFTDLLGAAALAPDAWPALLARVATYLGAAGAAVVLYARSVDGLPAEGPTTAWRADTGWTIGASALSRLERRLAWPGREAAFALASEDPSGGALGVAILAKDEHATAALVLARPRTADPFTPADLRRAEAFARDLRAAFATARRIETLARERDALAAALDLLPLGVALLARDGRVTRSNAAVRAMTAAGTGIMIRRGLLSAAGDADAARLRRAVREVAQAEAPRLVPIAHRRAGASCFVRLAPLPAADAARTDDAPAAVAILADPDADLTGLEPVLRGHYGLTPTEAEITLRLLAGARVETMARELEVSVNTIRTHLKRTFSKLDVTSQSDLVRIVARGAAAVVSADGSSRQR
ncbi:MAG: helix-turn-helix transcriptional regulator [Deltaproteobacteria bacterium]|nr:helix-turn-helix transcriptional regulator [Deltaproteobacteria bacterium]